MQSKASLAALTAIILGMGTLAAQSSSSEALRRQNERRISTATSKPREPLPAQEGMLSRPFSASALRALSAMKEWRGHVAYTLQAGYPLSEFWITADSARAQDALTLASLESLTDADRAALAELESLHAELREWSTRLLTAHKEMRMAQYYMSSAALQNDMQYQSIVACGELLTPMLTSGRYSADRSCALSGGSTTIAANTEPESR